MDRKRNLLPEYVWMIFVGILLAIIILMHITPGRAAESDFVTPIPTSSIDPTDACLCVDVCGNDVALFTQNSADFYSLRSAYQSHEITKEEFLAQAYFVRYASAGPFDDFYRDVKIALTQLMALFPGFHVAMFDDFAATYPYIPLKEAIEEVGCPVREDYYPYSYSTNRVLTFVNTPFINAPVWVWDSNIPTPTPSPTPAPIESELVVLQKGFRYYFIRLDVSDLGVVLTSPNDSILQYVQSQYDSSSDQLLYNAFVYCWGSGNPAASFSFSASDCQLSMAVSQSFNESLGKDYYFENLSFTQYSFLSSETGGFNTSHQQYGLLVGFRQNSGLSSFLVNFSGYSSNGSEISLVYSSFSMVSERVDSINYNYGFSSSTLSSAPYLLTLPIRLGFLSGSNVGPVPTSTPIPSPTQAPLPTSGESIHVILPTGTPTPSPPFTIQPGEGGGNGSPGSFGDSGLSSGETSGILQAFSMYVSDNPVFVFLGGLFSAFPAELMYPLYILLFILIILGIIRVFIHFTGG